jgi:hypothetical protein
MQPISLDLDSLVTVVPGFALPVLILGALAFVGGLFLFTQGAEKENILSAIVGLVLFIPGLLGFLFGGAMLSSGDRPDYKAQVEAIDDRNELISTQIDAAYGLQLTEGEVNDLEYPTATSEKDFEVFGSIVRNEQLQDADFSKQTIYLVWANDELQLSQSADGESFQQLDRQD